MCCPASLALQETTHSTKHARDHRTSIRRRSRSSMWVASQGLGREVVGIEIRIFRHIEVRRITFLDGCSNGIREPGVWPIPRATISSDRAIDRLGLRHCLAAVDKATDLPCRQRDIRARREHRSSCRSRSCRQSGQADADTIAFGARCPRFADRVLDRRKHAGQALARHRERPRFAPDCSQISACITFGSTLSAQAAIRVTRSMKVYSNRS